MDTKQALAGAIKWIEVLCEEQDIDPEETFVHVRNVKTHEELVKVSLARSLAKYKEALDAQA